MRRNGVIVVVVAIAIIVFGLMLAREDITSVARHISDNRLKRIVEKTKQIELAYEPERLRHERTMSTSDKK